MSIRNYHGLKKKCRLPLPLYIPMLPGGWGGGLLLKRYDNNLKKATNQ